MRIIINDSTKELLDRYAKKRTAITFSDITLEDKRSEVHPNQVNLDSWITPRIKLKGCGIMSAAMDTVTEKELALELAKLGGVGIIHRNLDPSEQADMIQWVRNKIHDGGMIQKPVIYRQDQRLSELEQDRIKNGWTFNNIPILDDNDILVGMVSRNERQFAEGDNPTMKNLMKPLTETVFVKNKVEIMEAYKIMKEKRVKKLPVTDHDGKFIGMYTWKDVVQDENKMKTFSLDEEGHFIVGAAISVGTSDYERIDKLAAVGCKLLVIDTSHGACKPAIDTLNYIKTTYGDKIEVIIGNIASYDSAHYLLTQKCKPDALKVGIGSGSICTTRRVTGHGMPQITAIYQVYKAIKDLGLDTPIIVDGGLKYSSDVVKALAVGASGFMFGNVFAGTDESPGSSVVDGGQKFKVIRGMGSLSAMNSRAGSRDRYFSNVGAGSASTAKTDTFKTDTFKTDTFKTDTLTLNQMKKTVPEGVEGFTKYRGSTERVMIELLGGIRAGLAHSGAHNIFEFRELATIWIQTLAGITEGDVHSLTKILD
jgi:IMP dehydrogenase